MKSREQKIKVVTLQQAFSLSKKFKTEGKTTVLVGGCFDIFHYGHFMFLKNARKKGEVLFIALENDERVKILKGIERPITPQNARAEILSSFPFVDFVFTLPTFKSDMEYRKMTIDFAPSVIALTKGDINLSKKERFAKEISAKIRVINHINTPSSSQLYKIITKEK